MKQLTITKNKKMSKTNNNPLNDNFIKTESSSDSSTLSRFKDLNLSSEKNDLIENTHLPEYIRIKAVGQGTYKLISTKINP